MKNIRLLCHNCIKFEIDKIIYTDPFKLDNNYNDADIVLITHSHFDHFSEEDILKVINNSSKICVTQDLKERTLNLGIKEENIILVKPNEIYNILGIKIETIPAYNVGKHFHPRENNWVGYIITMDNETYYIAGDTDVTEENKSINVDYAFVPVRWYIYYGFERSRFINKLY